MRAAVVDEVGGRFAVHEVQIADPIGQEVLVDVKASGLCHSDLHVAENDFGFPMPSILGHEIAGVVRKVGPDAVGIVVGDHVVGQPFSHCGHCRKCLAGRTFECPDPLTVRRAADQPPRLSRDGVALTQFSDLGGFAEQVLTHRNNLIVIDPAIPFDRAALIGCSVVTGAGAVINTAAARVGDTVAVVGCGGVGLNAIQGAALVGARRIIAIDVQPAKLELARRFGATDVIDPTKVDDVVSRVRDITGTDGVDHAFEAIGLPATAKQAVEILGLGGGAYLIGMQRPGTILEIDPLGDLLFGRKSIHGVFMGSTNAQLDIPLYVDLYLQGRLNLDDLVAQTIGLDDINEGYDELRTGGIARSVITFS